MIKILTIALLLFTFTGCDQSSVTHTPEMETEAKNTVLAYLTKNNLPHTGLAPFNSAVEPKPDFAYLYKGGGRCIEFIILCYGQSCKELRSYPYDKHGEKCP